MVFGVTWDGIKVYPNTEMMADNINAYLSRHDDMGSVAVPAIYVNSKRERR